jgi:hypothetical protein
LRKKAPLIAILIILFAITLPNVRAQTTSITSVQSPTHVVITTFVSVKVALNYDSGSNGAYVFVAIWDMDVGYFAIGTATSSQCIKSASGVGVATCYYTPASTSGSDVITFSLQFYFPRTYHLHAIVGFDDSAYQIISDSVSIKEFAILATDTLSLTVRVPFPVNVSIDGAEQSVGSVSTNVNRGEHTIAVPGTVQVGDDVRFRFDHWTDGESQTTRIENLQDDAMFEAVYAKQYRLTLESPQVRASGDGWYDEGSSAEFLASTNPPMSGILGVVGGRWVFQGWYEAQRLVSRPGNGSITMDQPHTLTAHWNADYTGPLVIVGITAAVAVGIVLLFLRGERVRSSKRRYRVAKGRVKSSREKGSRKRP